MVIVAAVDQSNRATDVVTEAKTLAEAFEDTVHVIHVLDRSDFVELERTSVDKTGTGIEIDQVRAVAADIAADATVNLDSSYETVGLMGDPAERIVEYAGEQDARYIVVGGRKRSPAGKMIFGSVSQSVLLNSPCPVVSSIE